MNNKISMKKKILVILLVISCCVTSIVINGCGNSGNNNKEKVWDEISKKIDTIRDTKSKSEIADLIVLNYQIHVLDVENNIDINKDIRMYKNAVKRIQLSKLYVEKFGYNEYYALGKLYFDQLISASLNQVISTMKVDYQTETIIYNKADLKYYDEGAATRAYLDYVVRDISEFTYGRLDSDLIYLEKIFLDSWNNVIN